jgi:hypothetical protein
MLPWWASSRCGKGGRAGCCWQSGIKARLPWLLACCTWARVACLACKTDGEHSWWRTALATCSMKCPKEHSSSYTSLYHQPNGTLGWSFNSFQTKISSVITPFQKNWDGTVSSSLNQTQPYLISRGEMKTAALQHLSLIYVDAILLTWLLWIYINVQCLALGFLPIMPGRENSCIAAVLVTRDILLLLF